MGISLVLGWVNSKSIFRVIFHQCSVFYEQNERWRQPGKSFLLSAFSEREKKNCLALKPSPELCQVFSYGFHQNTVSLKLVCDSERWKIFLCCFTCSTRLSTSLFGNMPSHKYLKVLFVLWVERQFAPLWLLRQHSSDNNYSRALMTLTT